MRKFIVPLLTFVVGFVLAAFLFNREGGTLGQVETVALWAGLITGIVGIVLAVVSMIFANLVNERADDLSVVSRDALTEIRTMVSDIRNDQRELVKVAWDSAIVGDRSGGAPDRRIDNLLDGFEDRLKRAGAITPESVAREIERIRPQVQEVVSSPREVVVKTPLPTKSSNSASVSGTVTMTGQLSDGEIALLLALSDGLTITADRATRALTQAHEDTSRVADLVRFGLLLRFEDNEPLKLAARGWTCSGLTDRLLRPPRRSSCVGTSWSRTPRVGRSRAWSAGVGDCRTPR